MPSSVSDVADVLNLALVRIGYKDRVGSIWEGSDQAKNALDVYSQTRDAVLMDGDWQFCERSVSLTLQKSAPVGGYIGNWDPTTNPILPWAFQYAWPTDCLKVRAIRGQPLFLLDPDPQPVLYATPNDPLLSAKVIVTNVPNAILTYAGQVTNPADWTALFVETMAAELGRRLAPVLMNMDAAKFEAADAQMETSTAKANQG